MTVGDVSLRDRRRSQTAATDSPLISPFAVALKPRRRS